MEKEWCVMPLSAADLTALIVQVKGPITTVEEIERLEKAIMAVQNGEREDMIGIMRAKLMNAAEKIKLEELVGLIFSKCTVTYGSGSTAIEHNPAKTDRSAQIKSKLLG
jgi:2,4-dienoyl-CoA reductase-like NADH-dependent reductase (Old Yellow Enzyme family)